MSKPGTLLNTLRARILGDDDDDDDDVSHDLSSRCGGCVDNNVCRRKSGCAVRGTVSVMINVLYSWPFPILVVVVAVVGVVVGLMIVVTGWSSLSSSRHPPLYHAAFIGNSMQYYNDLPRFMEAITSNRLTQNSCLHADATLSSILRLGNGMFSKFITEAAMINASNFYYYIRSTNSNNNNDDVENNNDAGDSDNIIYDYGACSVPQLLFGRDDKLDSQIQELIQQHSLGDDEATPAEEEKQQEDIEVNQDSTSFYLYDDGNNPCLHDLHYYRFLQWRDSSAWSVKSYDFIILNDNTRSPARTQGRADGLFVLEHVYIPFFQSTKAIPVFIHTHAYWANWRDLSGLIDLPTFTSYTYAGYKAYADLVNRKLKQSGRKARIAPAGIAFLMIWEENYPMWQKLFHTDGVHASPYGTFLEGCILHVTLFQKLPDRAIVLPNDEDSIQQLWRRARRMQPPNLPENPMPTINEAAYLYEICKRVAIYHQRPKSFFATSESANFTPQDYLYSSNSAANDVDNSNDNGLRKQ